MVRCLMRTPDKRAPPWRVHTFLFAYILNTSGTDSFCVAAPPLHCLMPGQRPHPETAARREKLLRACDGFRAHAGHLRGFFKPHLPCPSDRLVGLY
jgi:hypothetical protein